MTSNSRPSSTRNAPIQNEDKNRIKNNIRHSTCDRRNHSESRSAVSANDGIQHIAEHVDWEEAENNEEILPGVDKVLAGCTEEAKNLITKSKPECDKNETQDESNKHAATDGAMSVLRVLAPLANREEGGSTVTKHARKCDRNQG